MSQTRQVVLEIDRGVSTGAVGNRFGIEPIDDEVLDGKGKKVVAGGVVMSNEVTVIPQ